MKNHTKTNPKADGPTRGTIKTIRKSYKTIRKLWENLTNTNAKADGPMRGTIRTIREFYKTMGKPYEHKQINEGDD